MQETTEPSNSSKDKPEGKPKRRRRSGLDAAEADAKRALGRLAREYRTASGQFYAAGDEQRAAACRESAIEMEAFVSKL